MNRSNRFKIHEEMDKEIEELKKLIEEDPETAKIVARAALIRTGVLNEDGSSKENIVDYPPHIGCETNNKPKRRIRK